MKWVIYSLLTLGWFTTTWGIAELTTVWVWPISIGLWMMVLGAVLLWAAASEIRAER